MSPDRNAALLSGQTTLAQKVYAVLPAGPSGAFSPLEIAKALREHSGASLDIHTMRGCLSRLKDAGLVREIVPGSFRRVEVKEKVKMNMPKNAVAAVPQAAPAAAQVEPMELLAGIASKVRTALVGLGALADEIEQAALVIEERASANAKELAKVKQIATLLKELG